MKNFSEEEFYCCEICRMGFKEMDTDFLFKLDLAREYTGVPFVISSSIRCKKHNKKVGGSKTSSHLKGLAVDIECGNDKDRYKIIAGCKMAGITRIGISKTFLHLDSDGNKNRERIWVY